MAISNSATAPWQWFSCWRCTIIAVGYRPKDGVRLACHKRTIFTAPSCSFHQGRGPLHLRFTFFQRIHVCTTYIHIQRDPPVKEERGVLKTLAHELPHFHEGSHRVRLKRVDCSTSTVSNPRRLSGAGRTSSPSKQPAQWSSHGIATSTRSTPYQPQSPKANQSPYPCFPIPVLSLLRSKHNQSFQKGRRNSARCRTAAPTDSRKPADRYIPDDSSEGMARSRCGCTTALQPCYQRCAQRRA